ncbi:hypothetical protein BH11PSE9_BH11PSE9_09370 [soil metagenome]
MPTTPPLPTDEAERLNALRELVVLDSAPEPVFDSIAQLASQVCGVPVALLSLIDTERQWFKANVGLPGVNETPRDVAFCAHAITGNALFEVPDATLDPRFADNPLVTGAPDIRFYAGAPLVMPGGARIGTLCVIDRQARHLDAGQAAMLTSLAAIATQALVMRRDLIVRSLSVRSEFERALAASQSFLRRTGRVAGVGGWEVDIASGKIVWSEATRRIHGVSEGYVPTLETAVAFYPAEARAAIEAAVQRGIATGEPWDMELPFVNAAGQPMWVRAVGEVEFEGATACRLVGAFQDITVRKTLERRLADNERFVRQITDSLPVRIAYLDRELRFRFANQAHAERFGKPREEILGHTRRELTGGCREDDPIEAPVVAVLAGEPQRFEFEETVRGELRRIESRLVPDVGESGEVRGFYSTGIDITERAAAEKSLRVLSEIVGNSTDFVVQTDWRGRIIYMNPAVRRATGLAPDEPVAHRNFAEFNTPATNQLFDDTIMPAVKANGSWVGDTTVLVADRRKMPVSQMVIAHRDATGRIEHYSSVMRDITDELQVKQQLQRQAATLRSVTEAIPALVGVVGADRRYRFVNGAFERWRGGQRSEMIGRTVAEVLGRTDYERSREYVDRALAGKAVSFEKTYAERTGTRHLRISYIPLWLDSGAVDGFVSVAQDITQHKQEELRLLQLTQRDPLTGLLNRSGFEAQAARWLAEGHGASLALLCIDLDHFKPVNDAHGHPAGDQVLQLFAQRLQRLVRPTDAVARPGGDEFAVLLSGVRRRTDVHAVAAKVLAAAAAPFLMSDGQAVRIGASVGVAFGTDSEIGLADLMARADAMLYRAKESGRGQQAGAADCE